MELTKGKQRIQKPLAVTPCPATPPKKEASNKKSRTFVSKNRDVFRSPRSTQFDDSTEHMLTLRRSSLVETDTFHENLFLVFDDSDDDDFNKVANSKSIYLRRPLKLPMRIRSLP
jgi:hypothetical protein